MNYVEIAQQRRQLTKASEMLLGLVTGIIADQQLHDLEVKMLSTWLSGNVELTQSWPGSILARQLADVLADGVITETERSHLLQVLQKFSINDFAETGSASPEVTSLPINDSVKVTLMDAVVCLTGEFIYGTRERCSQASSLAGATIADTVSKKVGYLIVGTNVSPHWANTSYGRKIKKAVDLQSAGAAIHIISEQRWMAALPPRHN
jgi:NAD-dependent DNA ligase